MSVIRSGDILSLLKKYAGKKVIYLIKIFQTTNLFERSLFLEGFLTLQPSYISSNFFN